MAHNDYIVLTNSNASISKRFKVIEGGWNKTKEKVQSVRRTINGYLSISQAGVWKTVSYIVRVKHTEPDSLYGSLVDLEYFHGLDDATATPSDLITLTDHYGDTSEVYFTGSLDLQPISVAIEGEYAIWFVQIVLMKKVAE